MFHNDNCSHLWSILNQLQKPCFCLYMLPSGSIIHRCHLSPPLRGWLSALYLCFTSWFESCPQSEISDWMAQKCLQSNKDKTESLVIGGQKRNWHLSAYCLNTTLSLKCSITNWRFSTCCFKNVVMLLFRVVRITVILCSQFLYSNDILYTSQSGFRKSHNTIMAALKVINGISMVLDKKQHCTSLFIDLSKFFWHNWP